MSSHGDSVWVCGVKSVCVSSVMLNRAVVDSCVAVRAIEVSVVVTLRVSESPVSIIEVMSAKPHCFVSVVATIVVHAPTSIVGEISSVMLGAVWLSISLLEHCSVVWAMRLTVLAKVVWCGMTDWEICGTGGSRECCDNIE